MNFGSKHVYFYENSDEECVSDDEFEHGMSLSDSDEEVEEVEQQRRTNRPQDDGDRVYDNIEVAGALSPSAGSLEEEGPPVPSRSGRVRNLYSAPPEGAAPPPEAPESGRKGLFSFLGGRGRGGGLFSFGRSSEPKAQLQAAKSRVKKKKSHWRTREAVNQCYSAAPVTGRTYRRADTNVLSIKFDKLTAPSNMHTGDPVYCDSCRAVLSHISKLQPQGEEKLWVCEYCGEPNTVDLMDEEIPSLEDTTYMLSPAPATTASGRSGVDETLVIFCIDTSGSMCVTTEVPGKVRLRGADRLDRLQQLNDTRESQWMPGQRRNVTYVSRLQGVQAAVDHQLGQMAKEHPKRKVALITFNNEVTLVGDGTGIPVVLSGDKLGEQQTLLKAGREVPQPKTIEESRNKLGDNIFELEEKGATALGPALLMSVAMACQIPGSKVIICTDGLANVGLGSLENTEEDDQVLETAQNFYKTVSDMAVGKGVSVSVISMKGTNCKMVELGKVADATGGQVNIVDPLKLTEEFGSILANPIIATNVTTTMILHKGLYFRQEESKSSRVERYVGNVTKESEITFEYGVRNPIKSKKTGKVDKIPEEAEEQKATAAGDTTSPQGGATAGTSSDLGGEYVTLAEDTELPFQLHIQYVDLEGAKALRVLTQTKPITKKREVAEKSLNTAVMGVHTAQTSANMAEEGMYTQSRLNAFMHQRLMSRASKGNPQNRMAYKQFYSNIQPVEMNLNQCQHNEIATRGRTWSDSEEDDDVEYCSVEKPKKKSKARRKVCTDDMANAIYISKAAKGKHFDITKKK